VGEREGELGANFSSIVMPRMNSPWHIVPEPGGVGGHFARTSDPRNRRNAKETETRSVATGHNSLWTLCKFRPRPQRPHNDRNYLPAKPRSIDFLHLRSSRAHLPTMPRTYPWRYLGAPQLPWAHPYPHHRAMVRASSHNQHHDCRRSQHLRVRS